MRLWFVSVHVKVPRGLRQLQLQPFELLRQRDLTAEAGVLLQERGHIEQIVLFLLRGGQLVAMLAQHVHVTRGAGQRRLTGTLHLDAVPVGQVKCVVTDFAPDLRPFAVLVDVRYVDPAKWWNSN